MVGMMMGYSWLVQISLELARTDRLSRNCTYFPDCRPAVGGGVVGSTERGPEECRITRPVTLHVGLVAGLSSRVSQHLMSERYPWVYILPNAAGGGSGIIRFFSHEF